MWYICIRGEGFRELWRPSARALAAGTAQDGKGRNRWARVHWKTRHRAVDSGGFCGFTTRARPLGGVACHGHEVDRYAQRPKLQMRITAPNWARMLAQPWKPLMPQAEPAAVVPLARWRAAQPETLALHKNVDGAFGRWSAMHQSPRRAGGLALMSYAAPTWFTTCRALCTEGQRVPGWRDGRDGRWASTTASWGMQWRVARGASRGWTGQRAWKRSSRPGLHQLCSAVGPRHGCMDPWMSLVQAVAVHKQAHATCISVPAPRFVPAGAPKQPRIRHIHRLRDAPVACSLSSPLFSTEAWRRAHGGLARAQDCL